MIIGILVLLIILWALGYVNIPYLQLNDINLITILGRTITLYDVLIFAVIVWLIDLLPYPFRQIAGVILFLWVLSLFGIIAIANLSNILVLALIIGLIVYIVSGRH